jgi:hypothetical protein
VRGGEIVGSLYLEFDTTARVVDLSMAGLIIIVHNNNPHLSQQPFAKSTKRHNIPQQTFHFKRMAQKRIKAELREAQTELATHDVSLNNAEFPSIQNDSYRLKMKTTDQGVLLWIESRTTKEQWQNTFVDVSKCGASAIPSEKVFAFLEVNIVCQINEITKYFSF